MGIPEHVLQLPEDLRGLLESAKQRQSLPSGLFDTAVLPYALEQETLFVFWGDWHLGAEGVDYAEFERDLAALQVAKHLLGDRLQIIAMGDYIDGYLPSGTPRNPTQILSPREQRLAASRALNSIRPLIVLAGDHDEWHSKQAVEYDWLFELCHQENFPFAQWGTTIEVDLPTRSTPVRMLVRHRFKGTRTTDVLRPHKNLHLELGPADIVVLAHTHSYPGCFRAHAKRRTEGEFLAVQSGTYKLRDDYGKKLGYLGADYGVPAVLIEANGELHPFDSYQDGLEVLL